MADSSSQVTLAKLAELENVLLNTSGNVSLAQRFRALFTLKAIGKSEERVVDIIGKGESNFWTIIYQSLNYPFRFHRSLCTTQARISICARTITTTKGFTDSDQRLEGLIPRPYGQT